MPRFDYEDRRLAYAVFGDGPRVVVLIPGLLLPRELHTLLARDLAARGHRVVTFDPLGHGESDRSTDMWRFSMSMFAEQVVALLDHLDADEAVIGGTSLGANVTLEGASLAPARVRGMLIEMPVLDNALVACAVAFTPLLVAMTLGGPAVRLAQLPLRALPIPRRLPGRLPHYARVIRDWLAQDPAPAAAVLQGLFFGRIAPHRAERRTFGQPALVIGHRRDPIHPFSDADMLAHELPDARLLDANSLFELRLAPDRLTNEIDAFLSECWRPRRAAARRTA